MLLHLVVLSMAARIWRGPVAAAPTMRAKLIYSGVADRAAGMTLIGNGCDRRRSNVTTTSASHASGLDA